MFRKLICLASFVLVLGLVGSTSAAIPPGWSDQDIGTTGGSADEAAGTWTISGDGADIWGTSDAFHYAYVPLTGNGQIVARVVSNGTGSNNWAKGGVMIRETLTPGSKHAMMIVTGSSGGGAHFQWRPTTGSSSSAGPDASPTVSPPQWVKLVREGNEFSGFRSADGATWTQQGSTQTITMANEVYIGLCVTSHAAGEVRTFTFDNVSTELPKIALKPNPPDGAIVEDTWVSLNWSPGATAASHDVYLGESFTDVNDGAAGVFRGNQTGTFFVVGFPGFPYPDGLVPGTTYYWRIDEVEADGTTKYKGNVWSFFIPPKKAYNPSPSNGSKFVPTDVTLTWTAGFGTKLHTVYLGDNLDTVTNAAGGIPQAITQYKPGALGLGKMYYWRVDEFDGAATHKGDIWSFTTIPDIPIADPNLVGWWKFEAGQGTVVVDFSGHGNNGTLVAGTQGSVQWVPGMFNLALEFLGDDWGHVELPPRIVTTARGSITMWINTDQTDDEGMFWYGSETAGDGYGGENEIHINIDDPGQVDFFLEGGSNDITINGPFINGAGWTHVAATWDVTDGCKLYVNGTEVGTAAHNNTAVNLAVVRLGRPVGTGNGNRYYEGLMDDARLFNRAISAAQVNEIMTKGEDPLRAGAPKPRNNAVVSIDEALPLSWSAGEKASQHDVYFGTDRDGVVNADATDATGIYRGRQGATTYTPPEGVEWGGGPYYWRIDEYNTDGTISAGGIWIFTVADFLLVDDFESYDSGDNQIWYSWHDGLGYGAPGAPDYFAGNGTGSAVGDENTPSFTEETIVHGDRQSMPVAYDNNKQGFAKYSEVDLKLTAPRDWTKHGLGELSIWFRGLPGSVGSFTEAPAGTYTMTASGADIWNNGPAGNRHDEFHFAYKTLTGAGSIVARVQSVQNTNGWAKAGVMIRETLDGGSKHAFACVTPANGVASQGRDTTGGDSFNTAQGGITAPYWVKLERDAAGNFTVTHSANGTTWQPVTGATLRNIPMNSTVYIGLALTSHDAARTCQAVFTNVTTTGTVSPQWAHQDIGIASNAAEPLYVAVSNAAGQPAVVVHPDPKAAQITTWTEWVIPLSDLSAQGISLTNVDKLAIGLGTRGNQTTPGGSGKMYFDDIRLYRPRTP